MAGGLPRGGPGLLRAQVRGARGGDRPPGAAGADHRPGAEGRPGRDRAPADRGGRGARGRRPGGAGERLDALVAPVDSRREERKAARAKQHEEARTAKEQLVAEAEQLARERAVAYRRRAAAGAGGHLEGPAAAGPQGRRRAVAPVQPCPFGVLQAPQGALRVAGRAARGGQADQGEAGRRGRSRCPDRRTGGRPRPATAS